MKSLVLICPNCFAQETFYGPGALGNSSEWWRENGHIDASCGDRADV